MTVERSQLVVAIFFIEYPNNVAPDSESSMALVASPVWVNR